MFVCLSLWGPLGDTPPIRNKTLMGPCEAPKGTNTKVTSAKGPFGAYPTAVVGLASEEQDLALALWQRAQRQGEVAAGPRPQVRRRRRPVPHDERILGALGPLARLRLLGLQGRPGLGPVLAGALGLALKLCMLLCCVLFVYVGLLIAIVCCCLFDHAVSYVCMCIYV